jgi:hypothetical protein
MAVSVHGRKSSEGGKKNTLNLRSSAAHLVGPMMRRQRCCQAFHERVFDGEERKGRVLDTALDPLAAD